MLLWPAIFMMVNASAPASPEAGQHRVAQRVHNKFLGPFKRIITDFLMLMVKRCSEDRRVGRVTRKDPG